MARRVKLSGGGKLCSNREVACAQAVTKAMTQDKTLLHKLSFIDKYLRVKRRKDRLMPGLFCR